MKILLLFILICFILVIGISADDYGDGDVHVYHNWIYDSDHCYDFMDTTPYELARIHVDFYNPAREFTIGRALDIKYCVSFSSYAEKNVIIHLYETPTEAEIKELETLLGPEHETAWLHYDLPRTWQGQMVTGRFQVIVVGIAKENNDRDKYSVDDLKLLLNRLNQLPASVQKVVQLNIDMILKSDRFLKWEKITKAAKFTLLYTNNKLQVVDKEKIRGIVKSPIVFTIWDVGMVKPIGPSSRYPVNSIEDELFGPKLKL